jgi:hypothetical protein
MVSDASEDIESARTRQEGMGMIFAFLFPDSDCQLARRRHFSAAIVLLRAKGRDTIVQMV